MPRIAGGEVFVAKLQIGGGSACPPPGTYVSVNIALGGDGGSGGGAARAFLTAAQARELGRWLCRPTSGGPPAEAMEPTSVRPAATEWPDALADRRPAGDLNDGVIAVGPPMMHVLGAAPAAGDRLVTARFVTGVRERWAGRPTAELERELSTFEPDLARMTGRLLRGTVAGHLAGGAPVKETLADACRREALVLLLALRGAYADLWHGVLFGDEDTGDASA